MASSIRKVIATSGAPEPLGPYSQAVLLNNTLYVSGLLGLDKDNQLVPGGVGPETRQALTSLGHILEAANSSFDKVVKTRILLRRLEDKPAVDQVYKEFFSQGYPARCAYQVGDHFLGASIEIEVIAAVGPVQHS